MSKRRIVYLLAMILLLIVAAAGWFTTDYLGNIARQGMIREGRASVLTLSVYVSATLSKFEDAVNSLAGSPWIAPALLSKGERDIEQANTELDRYSSAFTAISYLMDADGMTVASSNRKTPDNFVGNNYSFRPYFQKAARGQPGRYFALGITSGKRGFYASYPVQNHLGKVVGVVTMKKDIDDLAPFFRNYPFCFLISPDGIIFLSSTPAMVGKSLWPLDKAVQETLIASNQFGNILPEAFLKKEIADGTEVALEDNDYFVSREVIGSDGWSVVLLTPTDRIRLYRLIGTLATISAGLLFFLGIIYVRNRSQKAIRQSEKKYRTLFETMAQGAVYQNAEGHIFSANAAAERILGLTLDQMLGRTSTDPRWKAVREDGSDFPGDTHPAMVALRTGKEVRNVKMGVLHPGKNEYVWVNINAIPQFKQGETKPHQAYTTFEDITELKRAVEGIRNLNATLEQRVIERTTRLESINKELEAFSYSISHDLQAPLRSIDGFSQALLQDYPDKLDEQGKNYLQRVRSNTQRMGELIDDLLKLSRITRSEMKYEMVDLSTLAHSIATELHKTQPERQVEFVIMPGLNAKGDEHLLRLLLENLLGNAWKFTGKLSRARIEFGSTQVDGKQAFFVRDDGAGFDMTYADKLFAPFQRLHSDSEFPGIGIGLATAQRIVSRHGGRVWAEGEIEKGATFYFTLGEIKNQERGTT